MTLLVDPKQPEPITIGDRTYMMRPATVAERSRWRRAIAAAGGRQHGPAGLLNCLSAGVRLLMKDSAPEIRDAVLAKVDAQRDRIIDFFQAARASAATGDDSAAERDAFIAAGRAMNEGDADLAVIVAEVTANYPAYAQMVADEATYWPICGLEALRMFCTGWTGIGAPCERGAGGLTDESLAEVPEGDLPTIGSLYENLIRVTPSQRKNLLSRRHSSPAGETSST